MLSIASLNGDVESWVIGELEVDVLPVDETETDSTGNVQLNPIVSIMAILSFGIATPLPSTPFLYAALWLWHQVHSPLFLPSFKTSQDPLALLKPFNWSNLSCQEWRFRNVQANPSVSSARRRSLVIELVFPFLNCLSWLRWTDTQVPKVKWMWDSLHYIVTQQHPIWTLKWCTYLVRPRESEEHCNVPRPVCNTSIPPAVNSNFYEFLHQNLHWYGCYYLSLPQVVLKKEG